ncbi:hypothetical protein K9N68_17725 [Kovacikia minuta CCNUW1]|uniref:hypothetical protein n=1 Tax=Kovacikia minuta TaxID=2931930 RepID=UPI001CC91F00|nr:hypothetical protein [Kovacikia minuta]UBF23618.1 hypothetical protein K9N68_17725 [Kovacikia minuta CCNUW1]
MNASSPIDKPVTLLRLPELTLFTLALVMVWEVSAFAQSPPPDPAQFYQDYQPIAAPASTPTPHPPPSTPDPDPQSPTPNLQPQP